MLVKGVTLWLLGTFTEAEGILRSRRPDDGVVWVWIWGLNRPICILGRQRAAALSELGESESVKSQAGGTHYMAQ